MYDINKELKFLNINANLIVTSMSFLEYLEINEIHFHFLTSSCFYTNIFKLTQRIREQ